MSPEDLRVLRVECREGLGLGPHDVTHLVQALARKQEAPRIDVARLHEAACLLRTAAGIRPIHEPAPVVHEAVQVPACAGQSLAEILAAGVEEIGPDPVCDFEDRTSRGGRVLDPQGR